MDRLIQFFEKLITEFTWRRLIFILLLLFLAVAGTAFFESYTGYFRLGRIEKTTELLTKLTELSEKIPTNDREATWSGVI